MRNLILFGICQRLGQILRARRGYRQPYDPNQAVLQLRNAQAQHMEHRQWLKRLEERQQEAQAGKTLPRPQ